MFEFLPFIEHAEVNIFIYLFIDETIFLRINFLECGMLRMLLLCTPTAYLSTPQG